MNNINSFCLPLKFQSPIHFQHMEGLYHYIQEYSKFDGLYYTFSYQPLKTPMGTCVEIKFRTIEKIVEYVRKYWCI